MSVVVGSTQPGSFASTLPRQALLRSNSKLFYPRRQGVAKVFSIKSRHAERREQLVVAAFSMAAASVETTYSGLEGFEDRWGCHIISCWSVFSACTSDGCYSRCDPQDMCACGTGQESSVTVANHADAKFPHLYSARLS